MLTPFVRLILGMIIVLFFKCMTALFDPDNRRGDRVKWWLVSYTAIMFSAVTVQTGMNLDILSISYIDDREFPGINGVLPPGPWGYQVVISPTALSVIPSAMLTLCNWLADGLLVSSFFGTAFTRRVSDASSFPSSIVAT